MTAPSLPPLPYTLTDLRAHTKQLIRAYGAESYQAGFNEALEQVKARIGAMQNREVK